MKIRNILKAAVLSILTFGVIAGCGESKPVTAPKTLANLQTAYNGESNASAKYTFYAAEAEKAGYAGAAAFFRAASRSEGIHAKRHADEIKSMGAEPKMEIKLPAYVDVMTSLKDALAGETHEVDAMYPEFIKVAQEEGAIGAVEAFTRAVEAEKEHQGFYNAIIADLENFKTSTKTYYVCPVCGYTTDKSLSVCVLCAIPFGRFETFK